MRSINKKPLNSKGKKRRKSKIINKMMIKNFLTQWEIKKKN